MDAETREKAWKMIHRNHTAISVIASEYSELLRHNQLLDLQQEIYLKILENVERNGLPRGENPTSWVRVAARSTCRDMLRRLHAVQRDSRRTFSARASEEGEERSPDPAVQIARKELALFFMKKLDPVHQGLVRMHLLESKSFEEIGKMIGIDATWAREWYIDAMKKMRFAIPKAPKRKIVKRNPPKKRRGK